MEIKFSIKRVFIAVFIIILLFFVLVFSYFAEIPRLVNKELSNYRRFSFTRLLAGEKCIKAGSGGNAFFDKNIECCSSLTHSAITAPSDGECVVITNGGFICLDCGNGICEDNENICNCEADCLKE